MFSGLFASIAGNKTGNQQQRFLIESAKTHLATMQKLFVELGELDPGKGYLHTNKQIQDQWLSVFARLPEDLGEQVEGLRQTVVSTSEILKNKKIEKMHRLLADIVGLCTSLSNAELDITKKEEYVRQLEGMQQEQKSLPTRTLSNEEIDCYIRAFEKNFYDLHSQNEVAKLLKELVSCVGVAIRLAQKLSEHNSSRDWVTEIQNKGKKAIRSSTHTPASLQEEIVVWKSQNSMFRESIKNHEEAAVDAIQLPSTKMSLNG